jgi:hypothetical protein
MKSATSLGLLRRIALEPLPLILTDEGEFEVVSLLVKAGLVQATMQVILDPMGGLPQPGVLVHKITHLGSMTLQRNGARST